MTLTMTLESRGSIRASMLARHRHLPGEASLVLALLAAVDVVYLVLGTDPGGSLLWWAALVGTLCALALVGTTWAEELLSVAATVPRPRSAPPRRRSA